MYVGWPRRNLAMLQMTNRKFDNDNNIKRRRIQWYTVPVPERQVL